MPRKTSQAVKKDTAEAKGEVSAPRRSSRAVAVKQDPPTKDASRSRRSSTAAQTAASVADSRSPRARSGSQRESPSPSDAPATRIKTARRSTGRVNYRESDGEEDANAPKYDENFDSGEEFEESDSDEKAKPARVRGRSARTASKGSRAKGRTPARGRRGRPKKKDEEENEENEMVEVSDDSNDVGSAAAKKESPAVAAKTSARPSRSRRQTAEVVEVKAVTASQTKSRRSSGRASAGKDEAAKKRPSRSSAQPKRYIEDDDEVEEICEDKAPEEEGRDTRKRKRGVSPEEENKKLKDDEAQPSESDGEESEEKVEKAEDDAEEKEEPMDVDAAEPSKSSDSEVEPELAEEKGAEKEPIKMEQTEGKKVDEKMDKKEPVSPVKEDNKREEKKSEPMDEAMSITDSGYMSQEVQQSAPANLDKCQEVKVIAKGSTPPKAVTQEMKVEDKKTDPPTPVKQIPPPPKEVAASPKGYPVTVKAPIVEKKVDKVPDQVQQPSEPPVKNITESPTKADAREKENVKKPETSAPASSVPAVVPLTASDSAMNGAEQNNPQAPQASKADVNDASCPSGKELSDKAPLKENGAHNDMQNSNSVPPNDQYYALPGRKYVINSKLSESQRQTIKNQVFGFVSYNLGTPNTDFYTLKDKLLNEFSKLDAHLICMQQVGKHFFSSVLEPSLDALGFKSIFSQPEDSIKGMATFYKSSLFRLSTKSDLSLKHLIDKEIDASALVSADKAAVKSQLRKCGNVLFTHFSSVVGSQSVTVANVQIPSTDLSTHALQVSCLAQEVLRLNGGTSKPILLGGEFNIAENDASYQLLRDGYLSNEMIEELSRRKDISLPDKENTSLLNLFWNSFQHPSCNLCSCYTSVLGHEFFIPELKTSSPDLLWYSVGSLHALGVLDVASDKLGDRHLSLKADIAFSH